MNVNMEAVDRAIGGLTPFRLPLANMTGEGVKNFVDAEKALIDSMMKHNGAKPAAKAARAKAPRRKRETARAAAATA